MTHTFGAPLNRKFWNTYESPEPSERNTGVIVGAFLRAFVKFLFSFRIALLLHLVILPV